MSATLDTTGWDKAVRKLAEASKKSVHKVMEQSAKLIMADIVRLTPPMGNAPSTESFNTKKDIGRGAVAVQIKKIYADLSEIGVVKNGGKLAKQIKGLAKNDPSGCAVLLNILGYPTHIVIQDFEPAWHKKNRDNRGRVRWPSGRGQIYVVKRGAIKKYIKKEQAKVGTAMSGWAAGVKKLKASKIPAWAKSSRAKSGGGATITKKGMDWTFEAVNTVPYIGQTTAGIRTVGRAIANQEKKLAKRIDDAIKHSAKKAGLK